MMNPSQLLEERDSLRHALRVVTRDSLELVEERDELRKENEALRGQVDACRRLDAEAWALVTAVSRPLTPNELANYPLMWGSESDFIEIIKDRMGAAPKIGENCPYCGCPFPILMPEVAK